MEIQKELSAIALEMSEEDYRNSEELHYSIISTFDEKGFSGLDHLFDKKESASLTLGQLTDVILTGDSMDFDRQFCVADFPSMGEKELQIANKLYELCGSTYPTFSMIPKETIVGIADEFEYQKRFKFDTKVDKLTEACSAYYDLKIQAGDRTVINMKTYEEATDMVRAIKESPSTSGYFAEDDPFSPVKRYYQLKFKANIDGIGYICMLDTIVVNYEKKVIYPCDLKTCGIPEYEFENNFIRFHYSHQARMYWKILRANLDNDPYFKDFKLEDFRFIVVNKTSLTPLVWKFPLTQVSGSLYTENGSEIRDPFEIGKELQGYLSLRPQVPNGINKDGINIINCLKPRADVQSGS